MKKIISFISILLVLSMSVSMVAFGDDYEMPKIPLNTETEHDWGAWVVTTPEKPATCTQSGKTAIEIRVCKINSSHVETRGGEVISPTGHDWGEWEEIKSEVAATCTENGTTAIERRVCKNDSSHTETRGGEEIAAIGHEWGDWQVTTLEVPATYTENGTTAIETRICANDPSHTETRGGEVIPAIGYTWGDWTETEPEVPATCTENGKKAIETRVCIEDSSITQTRGGEVIPATGHDWGEWTQTTPEIPATSTEDGKTAIEARVCNNDISHVEIRGGEVIPATGSNDDEWETPGVPLEYRTSIKKCTVSGITAKVYNGKNQKQKITVKYNGKTLVNNTDYTITYQNNKYVGTATLTVKGKGNYKDSVSKTFKINPKGTKLSKLTTPKKKQIKATYAKQATQTSGYQIQYSLKKNFSSAKTVTVKGAKNTSAVLKRLKSKKTYYVRVRTHKTVKDKKYYSAWSAAKSVKTK